MTRIMDRLFIGLGFTQDELTAVEYRGRLYIGMIFLSGWTAAFLLMSLIERV